MLEVLLLPPRRNISYPEQQSREFKRSIYPDAFINYIRDSGNQLLAVSSNVVFLSELENATKCRLYSDSQTCSNPVCFVLAGLHYSNISVLDIDASMFRTINPILRNELLNQYTRGNKFCNTSFPRCEYCNSPYSTVVKNAFVECGVIPSLDTTACPSCIRTSLAYCWLCNASISRHPYASSTETATINGDEFNFCHPCYTERLSTCSNCHSTIFKEWISDEGCALCAREVIHEYTFKPEPVFYRHSSDLDSPSTFYGIELEVEMKSGLETTTDIVASRFFKDIKSIAYLKKDSSLISGFEIVSHPGTISWWQNKDNPLFTPIAKLSHTCESYWRETCGLHVHVSRAAFYNQLHLAKFVRFFYNNPLLSSFIAERHQKYQAPFADTLNNFIVDVLNGKKGLDRHTAINLFTNPNNSISEQNTVEIRIFKGNMKRERILKNIEFVDAVLHFTLDHASGGVTAAFSVTSINDLNSVLTAERFKEYISINTDKWPNLWAYIQNYKRKN